MGNRAFIKGQASNVGVYLHWNGGIDSVEAFLEYCKLRNFRPFDTDGGYGLARFCQVVGNWFGGDLSIGVYEESCTTDEEARKCRLDNGVYIINSEWEIVKRLAPPKNLKREGYDRLEMLLSIDSAQPEDDRLGEEYIIKAIDSNHKENQQ